MNFYVYPRGNYDAGEIVFAGTIMAAKFCFAQSRHIEQSACAAEKRRD